MLIKLYWDVVIFISLLNYYNHLRLEHGPNISGFQFLLEPDNQLQLDSQLCLIGKKKLPGRGITGFQVFCFCFLC